MSKTIGNRYGAFGTLSAGEYGPRLEDVFISNAAVGTGIAAGVAVMFDTTYAITNGHMRVVTSDTANSVKIVGVALTSATAPGDEVRVVTRGPVPMLGGAAAPASGAGVGTTAAGASAASAAPSATVKNVGFALENGSTGTLTSVYVAPW